MNRGAATPPSLCRTATCTAQTHRFDGRRMSSIKTKEEAQEVLNTFVSACLTHPLAIDVSTEDVYLILLQANDVIDMTHIICRPIPRNDPSLEGIVSWNHPFASDRKHYIVQVLLIYGEDGKKWSKATAFFPM
jgi:hypothetical protein